jgi:cysteine-rich repeat protein
LHAVSARIAAAVLVIAACVTSHTVTCPDGTVCPRDSACVSVVIGATPTTFCATPNLACSTDGDACDLPNQPGAGTCHSGICLVTACGNLLVDHGEACDDGNTTGGDGCSADCQSVETCGNAYVDLIKGEQCDGGADHVGHDGCSDGCLLETARWRSLDAQRPSPRRGVTLVYDAHRRRTVVFGGNVPGQIPELDDTHEWDGQRWRAGAPTTRPERRSSYAMAYDGARDQVVMFGGSSSSVDTWTWNGSEWTLHAPATQPGFRQAAGMAFDAAHGKVVLFGGFLDVAPFFGNDTWLWDGASWTQVATTAPPGRIGFAMGYDPKRGVTVIFGGSGPAALGDLWEFDGTAWTQKTFTGGPSARASASFAYDSINQRLLLLGGNAAADVWAWDGTTWTAQPALPFTDPSGPRNAGASDPIRGVVEWLATNGVLYEFNGTSWSAALDGTTLAPEPMPVAREAASAAVDPLRREITLYGGSTNHQAMTAPGALNDTWTWRDGWRQQLVVSPPARWGAAMVYDATHDTTVLFGGCTASDSGGHCTAPLAETWLWKNHAWTHPSPPTSPPARAHAAMVWDAARARVVMFGGLVGSSDALGDMWSWDGTTWAPITPATLPPKRWEAAIGYDPIAQRVVLFGGTTNNLTYDDTWLWDGTTWSAATPLAAPTARTEAQLAYDAARGRLVLFGGRVGLSDAVRAESVADVWEWTGTTWDIVTVRDGEPLAAGRYEHALLPALDGPGVMSFGGTTATTTSSAFPELNDMWRLQWDGSGEYETCGAHDADGDGLVGCADPDCWWTCSPVCPPATTCSASPTCGDGVCDSNIGETCDRCPHDCNACPARCGNFTCDPGETPASCPGDCH